jgi:hypothetical protein
MNLRPLLLLTSVLPLSSACSDDSYAVVSVLTYSNSATGVAQFRVYVGNGSDGDTLHYPKGPTESLTIDTSHPITFSVEFSSSRGGIATFEVEPLSSIDGTVLGYGKSSVEIVKGKVTNVTVVVVLGTVRPAHGLDAGAGSDGGTLACDPYNPAAACGADQTCGLLCDDNQPAVGMCYLTGPGKPGDICTTNNDCVPGSQCFSFTAVGCSVMTCLRFCNNNDALCGEQGAYCNVPIQCGITPSFLACSRPCDPTGTATTACATGLACFVYTGDTTDCACAGLGDIGATCTQNSGCNGESGCSGCRAGLSCVVPTSSTGGTTGTCRPICSLATPICPTGTTCHAFDSSTRKLYGFCQ